MSTISSRVRKLTHVKECSLELLKALLKNKGYQDLHLDTFSVPSAGDIPAHKAYIPYKKATAKAIIIDGVSYSFQAEGGTNPTPSSVKTRVKYINIDELIIISDFDKVCF
ncbi:hypothetical protein [Sphingobacterium sp. ML3W]|uniref:hypothetical protein n=1 Tax=Sphingobacterium sp. ML3W TaxID=1538644 RepID=UPI00118700BB|nr:hypothetical protein [Sphingobacterium sp. ML3W]